MEKTLFVEFYIVPIEGIKIFRINSTLFFALGKKVELIDITIVSFGFT